MPQGPRKQCESEIYHVIARGVGQSVIFEDERDRSRFLGLLADKLAEADVDLLCWCLMDNHVHMLFRAHIKVLSAVMQAVLSEYASYFNLRHERVGHLFQGRFKSEPVGSESYLLTVVRYIHWNPVKVGLSADCSYRWSSYGEYLGNEFICNTRLVLHYFESIEAFELFHRAEPTEECLDISESKRRMTDDMVREIAEREYGERALINLASMGRGKRDEALGALKRQGASIRQLQRLTGIGRSIIQRA